MDNPLQNIAPNLERRIEEEGGQRGMCGWMESHQSHTSGEFIADRPKTLQHSKRWV